MSEGTSRRKRIVQVAVALAIVGVIVALTQLTPDFSLQSALDHVARWPRSSRPEPSSGSCCRARRS
jgi:hypothetical protein